MNVSIGEILIVTLYFGGIILTISTGDYWPYANFLGLSLVAIATFFAIKHG